MHYLKDATLYTIEQIREAHPNMSIPVGADLTELGYFSVEPSDQPPVQSAEFLTPGDPEEYAPNRWRETWVIQPAPPPPVPGVVSRFQARAALHIHGVLADVETAVNSADPIAQIAWTDAQEFRRDSPTIAAIAQALGWSDAFIDDLFITAGGITA